VYECGPGDLLPNSASAILDTLAGAPPDVREKILKHLNDQARAIKDLFDA
jgi:hypothetical protein